MGLFLPALNAQKNLMRKKTQRPIKRGYVTLVPGVFITSVTPLEEISLAQ